MSFNWQQYLALAHHLTDSASDTDDMKDNDGDDDPFPDMMDQEAVQRCAISRAYYAAFCSARNYLRDIDEAKDLHMPLSHQIVSEKFKRSKDKKRKSIGENLARLRRLRNKADYQDSFAELNAHTEYALKVADMIFSCLDELTSADENWSSSP